jgi:hypothetical protein
MLGEATIKANSNQTEKTKSERLGIGALKKKRQTQKLQ